MDEDNNNKLMTIEEQTQTIDKKDQYKQSLFSKTYFKNDIIESPQNDIKNKTNDNFDKSASLLNLLSSRTHFVNPDDFKIIPEIPQKGKTCTFTVSKLLPIKNKVKKKVNFNFIPPRKEFYLTASVNPIIKKREIKKSKSTQNLNLEIINNQRNIIDLIHEKEIQLCLDLIKTLPEKLNIKNKNKKNIKDFKTEETTNNLIRLIKTFNVDNIYTQRILEDQVLNSTILNSEINPLNTMSISMSTNYKTNMPINNMFKFNSSNYSNNKNLNTYSISLKNNSSILKNINDSNIPKNNNSIINTNLTKSKLNKSLNNKINNNSKASHHHFLSKLVYDPRSEINFHTGFVRSQKKIYDDAYSKYFKNSKKNQIRINNYRRKKEEKNKLSLPEIEEYKSIIKEIENRKRKALRKSQSVLNLNKEKGDLVLKDQLIEELNTIYLGQKNTFLNSIKDNFSDNEKVEAEVDSYKLIKNENIRNINKIKRRPNSFVDGYSLFDGKINKQLKEYNYILGNKFHDKEQKEEKADKLHDIYEEFENKINDYKRELLNEKNMYKQIYIPKIDFRKDKNKNKEKDVKIGFKSYNYIDNKISNMSMNSSSNNNDIKINHPVILSGNDNKKEKIYNEYIHFKNEYKKKYSLD